MAERPRTLASRRHWLLQVVVATSGSRQTMAAISFVSHLRLILVVYAWWILLQSWGTMHFSDHRGLNPSDVQVTGNTLAAKLTMSKTTGDVKDMAIRMEHFFQAPQQLWACRRNNGTTSEECAGQRQLLQSRSWDVLESSETRHQCQAEFVRRPFRRGGHSLAFGRPPLPKRLLSGRQSKVLQRP